MPIIPGHRLRSSGLLIYLGTYPILRVDTGQFVEYHLAHPATFLTIAHGLLLLLNAMTLVYLVRFRMSGAPSVGLQLGTVAGFLYFALHPLAFDSLLIWSHNSFSFAFGTLLLALLYRLLLDTPAPKVIPPTRLVLLSLGAGLLASFTIYLSAWTLAFIAIVAAFHTLRGATWRSAASSVALVVAGAAAGFLLGVLPLLPRMAYFMDWIFAITSHAHPYLLVAPELPLLTQWGISFRSLLDQLLPAFAGVLLLSVIAIVTVVRRRGKTQQDPASLAIALVLPIVCILLTVAVVDHPKVEYMLAVTALLPVLALAVVNLHQPLLAVHRSWERAIVAVVLIGTAASLAFAMAGHARRSADIARIEKKTAELQHALAVKQGRGLQGLVVVWTYGTYSPCFSLWFANDSTDNAFRREIGKQCPRQIAYDYFAEMVIPRQGAQQLNEKAWDMVIGCSEAFKKPELARLQRVEAFPDLQLSCGELTVAYSEP